MGTNTKSSRKKRAGGKAAEGTAVEGFAALTEPQKNFAKVVGQALAEAWRCKWRQGAAQGGTTGQQARDSSRLE